VLSCTHCEKDFTAPNARGQRRKYCAECSAEFRRRSQKKGRLKRGSTHNRDYTLRKKYGIGLEEANERLAAQGGVCPICREDIEIPLDDRKATGVVDHCHDTGEVRGILCNLCNRGLGGLRDSVRLLRAAAAYLEPAAPQPFTWCP
jgi:hypothetical protein